MTAPLKSWYDLIFSVLNNVFTTFCQPVLQKLQARAVHAMSAPPSAGSPSGPRMSPGGTVKKEDEELAALGGKTRLVPRKSPSLPSSPQDHTHQHTPSPKGSPLQFASGPQLTTISPIIQNGNGIDHTSGWQQPYAPHTSHTYDYGHYPVQEEQWNTYSQIHSPTGPMQQIQYATYEPMQPMQSPFIPTHPAVEVPMQLTDPNASWQSLYAQYNPA